jgi:hypothetical protein
MQTYASAAKRIINDCQQGCGLTHQCGSKSAASDHRLTCYVFQAQHNCSSPAALRNPPDELVVEAVRWQPAPNLVGLLNLGQHLRKTHANNSSSAASGNILSLTSYIIRHSYHTEQEDRPTAQDN